MGDLGVGNEAELVAGCDGRGGCAATHLEAFHVLAVDVGHPLVALVVLCLPDGSPFFGFGYAVDDNSGEAVWRGRSMS